MPITTEDIALPHETMAQAIGRIKGGHRGNTYQNGVRPGPAKLAQFREALAIRGTPSLYEQEDAEDATVFLKFFDPSGSWTWFVTEFSLEAPDGTPDLAFGLVQGHEIELGYINIAELAAVRGNMGIGIEIDMHWLPRPLSEVRKEIE